MKAEELQEVVRLAALEAVKEFNKSERKKKKTKIFQNTKKLMENYNRICKSVEEGITELAEVPMEDNPEDFLREDIYIDSILKSKLRSVVMLAHVDKCLSLLEQEQEQKNTHEKYLAFTYFYLDGMSYESIAEVYGYVDRTARRWVVELTGILGIYLFGSDAITMD